MIEEHCLPFRENLAAYALGALDTDEILALQAHLETCTVCQAELADYRNLTSGLLQAVPPKMPPAHLRRNLVKQLPSHQTRTPNLFARFFGQFTLGQVAIAAVMLVLVGVNLFSSYQIRDLQQKQASLKNYISTEQSALALLAYPETEALAVNPDVQELAGSMLVDRDKSTAVLFLWNLPALDKGKTYQVWLIDANGKRTSGGLFIPEAGQTYTMASIQSSIPIGDYVGIGVTVEPSGGSLQPTGSRVLSVDF